MKSVDKPMFMAGSIHEFNQLEVLFEFVANKNKVLFVPKEEEGAHGSKALWDECLASKEYWIALTAFLKSI